MFRRAVGGGRVVRRAFGGVVRRAIGGGRVARDERLDIEIPRQVLGPSQQHVDVARHHERVRCIALGNRELAFPEPADVDPGMRLAGGRAALPLPALAYEQNASLLREIEQPAPQSRGRKLLVHRHQRLEARERSAFRNGLIDDAKRQIAAPDQIEQFRAHHLVCSGEIGNDSHHALRFERGPSPMLLEEGEGIGERLPGPGGARIPGSQAGAELLIERHDPAAAKRGGIGHCAEVGFRRHDVRGSGRIEQQPAGLGAGANASQPEKPGVRVDPGAVCRPGQRVAPSRRQRGCGPDVVIDGKNRGRRVPWRLGPLRQRQHGQRRIGRVALRNDGIQARGPRALECGRAIAARNHPHQRVSGGLALLDQRPEPAAAPPPSPLRGN